MHNKITETSLRYGYSLCLDDETPPVDGIDIDMCGNLPFGVEVVLLAEKALSVCAAWHEENTGRLIESVPSTVPPEKIDASGHGEVGPRLDGDRGKRVDDVDWRVDRGFGEIGEFRK